MKIRVSTNKLADGSETFDVVMLDDHDQLVFPCVTEDGAWRLSEGIRQLLARHALTEIEE